MKLAFYSESDGGSGASRAALRIYNQLASSGIDISFFVGTRTHLAESSFCLPDFGYELRSKIPSYLEAVLPRLYKNRNGSLFSPGVFGYCDIERTAKSVNADIIQLFWVNGGFIHIDSLSNIKKPIVWRLSDMWPFTGGCHYSANCTRYVQMCGECPILGSSRQSDLSRYLMKRKLKYWNSLNITIVSPSNWLAECAGKSRLFSTKRIEVIPTGIDASKFYPEDKKSSRMALGLPLDKRLILFGALNASSDERKGFKVIDQLVASVNSDKSKLSKYHIIMFGCDSIDNSNELDYVTRLPTIKDDNILRQLYSAADVIVIPSLEDNLPNVALEALFCRSPILAFDIGGMRDIVEHAKNGWLASPGDVEELLKGLDWILADDLRITELGKHSEFKAKQNFSLNIQSERYLRLYSELYQTR